MNATMQPEPERFETAELGAMMREVRENLGYELSEVAENLRIRLVYLEAIEAGKLADLPGNAYVSGFLRAYSDYLGLDGEEIVRRFRMAGVDISTQTQLHLPSPVEEGRLPTGPILLVAILIAAAAYGGWYYFSNAGNGVGDQIANLPSEISGIVEGAGDREARPGEPTDRPMTPPADTQTPQPAAPEPARQPVAEPAPAAEAPPPERPATTESSSPPPPETADRSAEPATAPPAAESTPPTAPEAPEISRAPATPPSEPREASDEPVRDAPTQTASAPETRQPEPAPEAATPSSDNTSTETAPADTAPAETTPVDTGASESAPSEPVVAATPPAETETPRADTPPAPANEDGPAEADRAVTAVALPPARPGDTTRIVVQATADTYVAVRTRDNEALFSQLMRPGDRYEVPSGAELTLETGNAGGLRITVGGRQIPSLGPLGSVRRNIPLDAERLLRGIN